MVVITHLSDGETLLTGCAVVTDYYHQYCTQPCPTSVHGMDTSTPTTVCIIPRVTVAVPQQAYRTRNMMRPNAGCISQHDFTSLNGGTAVLSGCALDPIELMTSPTQPCCTSIHGMCLTSMAVCNTPTVTADQ
jgi:hypothetical protein